MNTVAILGAGRLGTSLGFSLATKGYQIISVSCQSLSSAKKSAEVIGEGTAFQDNKLAVEKADIIILSVPDDRIQDVVKELSSLNFDKKFVFHCSGILSSQVLSPLKETGAVTASIHPVQSIPTKSRRPDLFQHIYFGVEGDENAHKMARNIVKKLGGIPFDLSKDKKPLYHTACSVASNYFVVLMELAARLLKESEIKKELRTKILLSLAKGTLRNIQENSLHDSLTGPVSREDLKTLKSHLSSLEHHPSILQPYKALAQQALDMAIKEKRLSKKKINAMKDLLE
jgi:predicted short-subunit dehydrogenase-like oxidoreductase (DUF2520 family)